MPTSPRRGTGFVARVVPALLAGVAACQGDGGREGEEAPALDDSDLD